MTKRPAKRRALDVVPEDLKASVLDARTLAEAERLIDAYNECADRVVAEKRRAKQHTPANHTFFASVAAFARKHGVDPSAWIFTIFAQLGWKMMPPNVAFFQVKRLRWVEALGASQYTEINSIQAGIATMRTPTTGGFRPFRDLSPGAELAKRNLALRNRADLCILQADIHYGFHAQSQVCAPCPLASDCRERTAQLQREYEAQAVTRYKR